MKPIKYGKAICYPGYRKNQSPQTKVYPTYNQIKEDMLLLEKEYDYIRMYDSNQHAKDTLEVITQENINLKVMLGMDLLGEIDNPGCSWGGRYTNEQIAKHIEYNQKQLEQVIKLANDYKDIVLAVSAGNESVPDWNENLVSPARVLYFVQQLKKETNALITYCDNNAEWKSKLVEVAKEVDFISIHIYPAWLGMNVESGVTLFVNDYNAIDAIYPDKQVLVTETGWPTNSNNGAIPKAFATELSQKYFNNQIEKWSLENQVPCFMFEAFDEPWKGSSNENEPEKHWGLYFEDRTPKLIKK